MTNASAASWYYVKSGTQRGPVSPDALTALAREGAIRPSDLVWTEGMRVWTSFADARVGAAVNVDYARFGSRLLAMLLDGVALIGLLVVVMLLVEGVAKASGGEVDDTIEGDAFVFILFIVSWLYSAMLESSEAGATLGKRALRLSVVTEQGDRLSFLQASGRWLSKALSLLCIGIGFLAMQWSPRRQCWHDRLARTIVVKRRH